MDSNDWVDWYALLDERRQKKWDRFSWLTLRAVLSAANDVLGRGTPSLVRDLRGRWVSRQRALMDADRWSDDFLIPMEDATSFIVLGDPGEQDASQYAVVPVLLTQDDTDFMVICSDVIYPAGDVNDYVDAFYRPYRHFSPPIFALPGNHDWYDGLNGFMWNFCDSEPLPPDNYLATSYSIRERLARRLWRRAARPQRDLLAAWRDERAPEGRRWRPQQPGPYWAIETERLVVIGIDTGITGEIDREQGDWLVRVSSHPKPKVLLTGKPLLVNHTHEPGPISWDQDGPEPQFETVDDIVRYPDFGYVAAIGGDIHNYQHYRVDLPEKGTFDYIVSGGGGAYMSATHAIAVSEPLRPSKDHPDALEGVTLEEFACYPEREDSLRFYSARFMPPVYRFVMSLMLAIAGIAVAALGVLAVDIDTDPLEVVLVAAAALVFAWQIALGAGLGRGTRNHVPEWRRRVSMAMNVPAGLALGLAGWWLAEGHYEEVLALAAALIAGGGLFGWILRRLGPRAWDSVGAQAGAYTFQIVVATVAIWAAAPDSARPAIEAVAATLGFLIAVPALNFGLRAALARLGADLRPFSPALGLLFTTGAVTLAVLVINGRQETRAVIVTLGTLAAIVSAPFLIDYARRLAPSGHKPLMATVLGLILFVLWLLGVHETWAPRGAVAGGSFVAVTLIGIAVAHLNFLGAFKLLWRPGIRNGALSQPDAVAGIAWRDGKGPKPAPRVRRIVDLVYPGSRNPHGPLQRKLSEIFDSDDPPFFKNFLRLDVEGDTLRVSCFGVTGLEAGPGDENVVGEVEIALPPQGVPPLGVAAPATHGADGGTA